MVRVLFSSTSGDGHLHPLLPLAGALREKGHEVAFAMAASYAPRIEAAACEWLASGIELDELNQRTFSGYERLPALPDELRIFVARFALGDAPDRLADLSSVVASWHPDLLVFEPCDLAAPAVAAAAGVPTALHSFGRPLARVHYEAAEPYVEPLWHAAGVAPPALCGLYSGLYVDICPPSLRGERVVDDVHALALRPCAPATAEQPPAWVAELPRPVVYVTLGTIFNDLDRFRPLIAAGERFDGSLVVTVGRDNDPTALGPLPVNVRVERFVPQSLLMPHVDAVVSHGGSGAMLAALAHGLPQLMLPAGADQFGNAGVCRDAGVARVLMPGQVTTAAVAQELVALLDQGELRRRAGDLAVEIARMPEPRHVADELVARVSEALV